ALDPPPELIGDRLARHWDVEPERELLPHHPELRQRHFPLARARGAVYELEVLLEAELPGHGLASRHDLRLPAAGDPRGHDPEEDVALAGIADGLFRYDQRPRIVRVPLPHRVVVRHH